MDFVPVDRSPHAFQRPISTEQIQVMCCRAFGSTTKVLAITEFEHGKYNNTYRVDLDSGASVILRVAPTADRQFRSERGLMRSEYATVPFLAPVASLMPSILMADFTHEILDRDYVFQTLLPGVSGADALSHYPRPLWTLFYRQLGEITRKIHDIHGDGFGLIIGPKFDNWSDAFISMLNDIAVDIDEVGLDSSGLKQIISLANQDKAIFDQITEPRLLHGDLWTGNVMLAQDAPEPVVTGIFDCDRTLWGDPEADWTIFLARRKPGTERESFWETYGLVGMTPEAARRLLFYQARHLGAIILEHHRLENLADLSSTYLEIAAILDHLKN